MNAGTRRFELLNYVWLEGFRPYYFDGNGQPLRFATLDEALAELQDDFDTCVREIDDGDRDPESGYSADEFEIRCVETDERFCVELVDGKIRIARSRTINRVGFTFPKK